MNITIVRRISQAFFFMLFVWLCVVATVGERFWQLRGWPVNFFLSLDPLTALATMISTFTLYRDLIWALPVVVLTIVLGRVFCGWLCPFGSLHQLVGYLWNRGNSIAVKIENNRYRPLQRVKYLILAVFLAMAFLPRTTAAVQTGLLDPLSLMTRSIDFVVLPLADSVSHITSTYGRAYQGAWLVLLVFAAAVLANLAIPRFYCRFVCPLGALLGLLSRFALFRIGKNAHACTDCRRCEDHCEGACDPLGAIRTAECVMCLNCRDRCAHDIIEYGTEPSTAGVIPGVDVSRRGFLLSVAGGLCVMPGVRLSRLFDANFEETVIRPPGALDEEDFMRRCVKCGQCVRVCPTNVLQPGGVEGGFENLWTPVLNNRIGSSGCQPNCVACGQVCPTGAIRPVTLDEKRGAGAHAKRGAIKIGTAIVDRDRCLPWSMNRPCIVCQENCPVSPKAIYTDEAYNTVRGGEVTVRAQAGLTIAINGGELLPAGVPSGDYYCRNERGDRRKISSWTAETVVLSPGAAYAVSRGERLAIQVRLQRPFVDIERCTGCGICEHECSVSGKRAIRVSGIGDTRSGRRALLIKRT